MKKFIIITTAPTLYRLVSLNTRLLSSTRAELWNLPDAQNDHKSRPVWYEYVVLRL